MEVFFHSQSRGAYLSSVNTLSWESGALITSEEMGMDRRMIGRVELCQLLFSSIIHVSDVS